MYLVGRIFLVFGIVACIVFYITSKIHTLTPELFLSAIAAVIGAVLCAAGEVSDLRECYLNAHAKPPKPEKTEETEEE